MLTKVQRQQRVAEIVRSETIHSQQQLADRLRAAQIVATQATISRDLQELGVLKGPDGYLIPEQQPVTSNGDYRTLRQMLRREMRRIDHSGNIVVIGTAAGHANALAIELDRAALPEVLGSLAGDDTVMIVVRRSRHATGLVKRLRSLAE
jgi:transcriptional regulator of arginine metabolism